MTNRIYFSSQTKGFYVSDIHGSNMPSDVVEITKEQHVALLQEQSAGKSIVAAQNGQPIAIDRVVTILDQIGNLEAQITGRMRDEAITGSVNTGLGPNGEMTAAQFITHIRQQIDTLRAQL